MKRDSESLGRSTRSYERKESNGVSISIGIPAYNSSKHIKQTLESIERQSYNNIEVVIADNNSSDDTIKIVDEYSRSSKYKYIIYKNDTNVGAALNFRKVLELAKTDLFMWLGSHDLLEEQCIEYLIKEYIDLGEDHYVTACHYCQDYNNESKRVEAPFRHLYNIDTGSKSRIAHLNQIIKYPHAGSRMYGVFPTSIKELVMPVKCLYWDTLFMTRLHMVLRARLINEMLWTRRDTPNIKESTSQAIYRQLGFIYGTKNPISLLVPASVLIHIAYIIKDGLMIGHKVKGKEMSILDTLRVVKYHLLRIHPKVLLRAFKYISKKNLREIIG